MGRGKGKMTSYGSTHEKWQSTQYLRDMPTAIATARKESYDNDAITSKRLGDELALRKSRNYGHLRLLIEGRLFDDVREDAGDRRWIHSLTCGNAKTLRDSQDKAYNIGKVKASSVIINSNIQRFKSSRVPSLAQRCIETVALNLSSYDTESLKDLFKCLPPHFTEVFSILGAKYKVINDTNLDSISCASVESLTLGDMISDTGLSKILFSWNHLSSQQIEEPENWWETNLGSYEIPFGRSMLRQLNLLGCSMSLKGLSLIRQHFSNLELLVVHDVSFNDSEFNDSELPDYTFRRVFSEISTGLPCLKELHLSYCSWVSISALDTLVGSIRSIKNNDEKQESIKKSNFDQDFTANLVHLSKIVVQGIHRKENVIPSDIDALIKKFHTFCNITLIITI
jgi:hypothetical protein